MAHGASPLAIIVLIAFPVSDDRIDQDIGCKSLLCQAVYGYVVEESGFAIDITGSSSWTTVHIAFTNIAKVSGLSGLVGIAGVLAKAVL